MVRVRNELQDLARIDPELEQSAQEAESAQIMVTELAKFPSGLQCADRVQLRTP